MTDRSSLHTPLSPERHDKWSKFAQWDVEYFPRLVGLTLEGVRTDYCRTHLPWRAEITQPHGIGHGGAIATLIDSVVVPAIGSESAKLLATASLSHMLLN